MNKLFKKKKKNEYSKMSKLYKQLKDDQILNCYYDIIVLL